MNQMSLEQFEPRHEWLVCIDSDGCVFDTMEIKHKECFCPAMIKHWGLQPVSKYARMAWEYENLYSKDRGLSRFTTLYRSIELLRECEAIKEYEFEVPDTEALKLWLDTSPVINNKSLEESDDPVLRRTLEWSLESNQRIADMVYGIPPFPYAREAIASLSKQADIMIVSATAKDALEREWEENGLLSYVAVVCSQDEGTKKECIEKVKEKYPKDHVLMIGDAPGDKKAAHDNEALFYPIRTGAEVDSWKCFVQEYERAFFEGSYKGEKEALLIKAFEDGLQTILPW